MVKTYVTIVEKYCPVVGHNIPMSVMYREGDPQEKCLQEHHCREERGGCGNPAKRQEG